MRTKLILAATVLVALTGLSGAASAQGFGIYIGPPPAAYDSDYYGYGPDTRTYRPRAYGYRRYSDDGYAEGYRVRRGGCGTYRYWDGDRCAVARYR